VIFTENYYFQLFKRLNGAQLALLTTTHQNLLLFVAPYGAGGASDISRSLFSRSAR